MENFELEKRLVQDTQYIEWLYHFTDTHPNFIDDQWDYKTSDHILEDDYKKVKLLVDELKSLGMPRDEILKTIKDIYDQTK